MLRRTFHGRCRRRRTSVMETVPSLCATGTVGVAAVGFAFGHPQHSAAARPTSNKRRTISRAGLDDFQSLSNTPTTPSALPQTAPAPSSRLRKRTSLGRPLTSSNNPRGGTRSVGSTPDTRVDAEFGGGEAGHALLQEPELSTGHGPFAFEFKGSENTPPPNWLRRISRSSLKSGSPTPTPRPRSPSMSYSNGSTAPILPSFGEPLAGTSSRNKLVKRSSSQRALHGFDGNALHSTLRRPATSHQRSATLQQQFLQDQETRRPSLGASSMLLNDLSEDHHSYDESSQLWQPFFKPQLPGTIKDGSSRKRSANGMLNRSDTPKSIVPGITELPTLLLATSISSRSSNEGTNGRASNISALSRPFTPGGLNDFPSPAVDQTKDDVNATPELKQRRSFSISEMFPSPSPSTWMPRLGSLKRGKGFSRNTADRRVVSAPQASKTRIGAPFIPVQGAVGRPPTPTSRHFMESQTSPFEAHSRPTSVQQRGASSPLPPLNRLSAFEVNLPGTNPSCPTTPQPEDPTSPRVPSGHSSLSTSYPMGQAITKTRAYRYSSNPSEHGSTLLGSDNENSRLMSGDEDDMDSRSGTMYDSTRTGATGSSHSGVRRPPIERIFDESSLPQLPSKDKLITLQDLLAHESFAHTDQRGHRAVEEEQDVSTPVRDTALCKDDDSSTPMHETSKISSDVFPSPPIAQMEPRTSGPSARDMEIDQEDELWSFDPTDDLHKAGNGASFPSPREGSKTSLAHPGGDLYGRRESPPNDRLEMPSKSNIFEWSEPPMTDKDTLEGESPRPKTVHGRQGIDMRGSRPTGRRGLSALHLRSQSVPVPKDTGSYRNGNNPPKLLGNKGPSEDWDGDFDFDEPSRGPKQATTSTDYIHPSLSSGMLVPRAILERQASVHGQFGQVKELTLLVEELKRLQQQASGQGIMEGQSIELWKEAEGIINLATLDDEKELFPPRSPHSPSFDFDLFDEDSPRSRRRSGLSPSKEDRMSLVDESSGSQPSSRRSSELPRLESSPPTSRPRKESSAKAKSVLETIHQQRRHYEPELLDAKLAQKKLPFDTTSLKDLVTRAGVVTRALKEIVRRAENGPETPDSRPTTPRDPPYTQMFQQAPPTPTITKSPRVTQSPRSPRSQRGSPFLGGSIAGNDNDINGHMKIMTVV